MRMVCFFLANLAVKVSEYLAGTPATSSQMAKDVVTFLNWAAEPEHDVRKQYGIKAVILFSSLFCLSLYVKRFKWGVIKNRKICEYSACLDGRVIDVGGPQSTALPRPIRLDSSIRSYIIACFAVFAEECEKYFPRLVFTPHSALSLADTTRKHIPPCPANPGPRSSSESPVCSSDGRSPLTLCREWVARCLGQMTDANRTDAQAELRQVIADAFAAHTLWTTDWEAVQLKRLLS
jgi:hypothetical protein